MYKKQLAGPTAYIDVDDTIVLWDWDLKDTSVGYKDIECRGITRKYGINSYNLRYLIELSSRGHSIVLWSAGGADWVEAVIKALKLEEYVDFALTKPTYYVDDVKDTSRWMGKYVFFDIDGSREGFSPLGDKEQK